MYELSSDNHWYHKPGLTNVLKYKYTPTNDRIWTNEAANKYGNVDSPTLTNNSDIYFISYNEPHSHDFSYNYKWLN